MSITAAGAGSGLDIESIVSQLMTLERRPLNLLQQKERSTEAQVSAYGSLKSAISTFQDAMAKLSTAEKFKIFSPSFTDEDVLGAKTDSAAAVGIYSVEVQRLAQNHKLGSAEAASTDTFGGNASDALTLTVDGESTTIDLSTAKTLADIRDAINSAADNPGVTATILNKANGLQHLILTSDESGHAQRIELSYAGTVSAATLGLATINRDAAGQVMVDLQELDAQLTVDGYQLTASSNNASGIIDGLTLELKDVGTSTLKIERDTESIEASAKEFVDAYNGLVSKVKELQGDELKGDASLRSVTGRLRGILNAALSSPVGSFSSLAEVGITSDAKTGELTFDSKKFSDALNLDFASVSDVFANNNQGFAFRFDELADRLLDDDGFIELRVDTLNDRIQRYQDDQERMEWRLEMKEKALRAQYAALDSLVGSLQATSNFLFSQLGV